jgi:hypothetical protein
MATTCVSYTICLGSAVIFATCNPTELINSSMLALDDPKFELDYVGIN